MASIDTTDLKPGMKVEIEGQPYVVVSSEFVKPGKGQAFNRVRIKHLLSGKVVDKTFRSGEKMDLANIEETPMRLIFISGEEHGFMNDTTFEQITLQSDVMGEATKWMKEECEYTIIFHNGVAINVEPPTFMDFRIESTSEGARGDTASGRVMKPAILENGQTVDVPIFIQTEEIIRIDTRTGKYSSRAGK